MNKEEFLSILREHLTGEIPDYEIESNIRYYAEYITAEAGKSEEDKLNELGDPRLIAKTIIDAYTASKDESGYSKGYYSKKEYDDEVYSENENSYSDSSSGTGRVKYYSWNTMKWYQKLVAIVIIAIVLVVVFSVVMAGINLFFTVALPILVVIFIIRLIISLFR